MDRLDRPATFRMGDTVPFWAGNLLMLLPATVMILAVLDALPRWINLAVLLVFFAIPIPAAGWIIAEGVRTWKEHRPDSAPRPTGPPTLASAWGARLIAAVSVVVGVALMGGTMLLLASFFEKMLPG